MNTYIGMNAYTFMSVIGIYAYMSIYYIGISFMPIGIPIYIGMNAYYRHLYPYGHLCL